MDKVVTNIAAESFNRYFDTLRLYGYKKYSQIDSLIVLGFIHDLFNSPLSHYIKEHDYKDIVNTLYCLFGRNCMIDFPDWEVYDSVHHKMKAEKVRITEIDDILRGIEKGRYPKRLRIKA